MAKDDSAFHYWRSEGPDLRVKVQKLRADPTPCEVTVWNAIRNRAVEGIKFRRQHPFANFVLDFYAPEIMLAIEIDGDVHVDPGQKAHDDWRERKLSEHGVRVVRFTNAQVAVDLEGVLEQLAAVIREMREP